MYMLEHTGVASTTETEGVITTITKAAGRAFFKYVLPRDTGNFKFTINGNEANGSVFYSHELKMILNKMQTIMRNEIKLLAMAKLIIVVEDKNGKFWMLGRKDGMHLTGGTGDSGTALGDRNGYDLDFKGDEVEPPIEVLETVAAQLQTA